MDEPLDLDLELRLDDIDALDTGSGDVGDMLADLGLESTTLPFENNAVTLSPPPATRQTPEPAIRSTSSPKAEPAHVAAPSSISVSSQSRPQQQERPAPAPTARSPRPPSTSRRPARTFHVPQTGGVGERTRKASPAAAPAAVGYGSPNVHVQHRRREGTPHHQLMRERFEERERQAIDDKIDAYQQRRVFKMRYYPQSVTKSFVASQRRERPAPRTPPRSLPDPRAHVPDAIASEKLRRRKEYGETVRRRLQQTSAYYEPSPRRPPGAAARRRPTSSEVAVSTTTAPISPSFDLGGRRRGAPIHRSDVDVNIVSRAMLEAKDTLLLLDSIDQHARDARLCAAVDEQPARVEEGEEFERLLRTLVAEMEVSEVLISAIRKELG